MRKKITKSIPYLLLISFGLATVSAIFVFMVIKESTIKSLLEEKFHIKTGYYLNIRGPLHFSLASHGSIHLSDAVILKTPETNEKSPPMVHIKKIKLTLRWPDLLDGLLYVKKMTIETPEIHWVLNKSLPSTTTSFSELQSPLRHNQAQSVRLASNEISGLNKPTRSDVMIKPMKPIATLHKKRMTPKIVIKSFKIEDAKIVIDNPKKHRQYLLEHISMHNPTFTLAAIKHAQSSLAPWLHFLQTHGRLSISDVWLGQLHLDHVSLHYNLTDGKLTLSPVHYRFNNTPGVAGFLVYDRGDHLHVALRNLLNDAAMVYQPISENKTNKAVAFATMPLLLDIDSGKLTVNTNIQADIKTFSELDKHLNGTIKLSLREGRIRRFNLAYELRRLEDRINRIEDTPPPENKSTPFDLFSIQMKLANGKAKPFPVLLQAPDFNFSGLASLDLAKIPAWMHMRVYIKPQANKYKKLENLLNHYLKDINQGSIPLEFDGPLYSPSKLAIKVDDQIAEDILNNFFASWPDGLKKKMVTKLQMKLKKSLKKMQKRLNEGV